MQSSPIRRTATRVTVAALFAGTLLLVLPGGAAWAHAALEQSSPFDGETLADAPSEVVLDFNEPVTAATGGVRIHDSRGELLPTTLATEDGAPDVLRVELPQDLGTGSYIVTYRVLSADAHPIKGALVFSVGEEGGVSDSVLQAVIGGGSDTLFGLLGVVVRWITYLGTLLAGGAMAFLIWVSNDDPRRSARIGALGVALAAVGTLLVVPVQAGLATGRGLAAAVDSTALADTLGSFLGLSAVVRLVALVVLGMSLRSPASRTARAVGLGAAVALLGSLLLDGHTVTTGPALVVILGDAVHVLAGAVWFGGLACLAAALRDQRELDRPVAAADLVARFSSLATASLVAVVLAGLALSWAEVRALHALTSTAYGWTLLVKVAIAAVAIGLGAYNNRRLVPSIAALAGPRPEAVRPVPAGGSADRPTEPSGSHPAWRRLRRIVRAEVGVLTLVLLATAVLVNLQPAASEAGVTGAYSTYVDLGDGYEVNLVVDPNRAGHNEIHIYVLDDTGRIATDATDARFSLSMPTKDIGPIERQGISAGPGHWVVIGNELSVPGRWIVEVSVGISRFEELSASIPVTVNR